MTAAFSTIKQRLNQLGIPASYGILAVIFGISWFMVGLFGYGDFFTGTNLSNMVVRSVALGIVAVGQTVAILAASMDLSVAYLISVTAVMASFIMQGDPNNVPLAIVVVLVIGAFVGLVNGLIITKLKVNALITTLGTGLLMQGILNASFDNFAGAVPDSFQVLAYGSLGPIPIPILLFAIVALIGSIILRRTRFGANVYAVGGDLETARLSGIRTDRVLIGAHILCSLTAVISGLFIVSRIRAGAPWVGPDGVYDLESIAVVVLGGTALTGGRGGVAGTIAGVLIFGILDTLFNMLGVDPYLKQVLRGLIIIAGVAIYSFRSNQDAA